MEDGKRDKKGAVKTAQSWCFKNIELSSRGRIYVYGNDTQDITI